MNAITTAFIIGVISIICIGIWLMKGTIDFIAERNEQYRKDKKLNIDKVQSVMSIKLKIG